MTVDFAFRKTPFPHQLDTFLASRDLPAYALLWEQGCGKSMELIITAAHLYLEGKIDAVIVLAPNGVHTNWITDEFPAHLPERIEWRGMAIHSSRRKQERHKRQLAQALDPDFKGLRVLALSYDGIMVEDIAKAIRKFMEKYRVMLVADESTRIKTPGAKRSIRAVTMARYAPYRRILTGTPVACGPYDIYNQFKFLDEDYWKQHDMNDFAIFKAEFGVTVTITPKSGRPFPKTTYRKLEYLNSLIKPLSSRVTKEQALPHLPPKLYSKRYFEMTPEQNRAYDTLVATYRLELENNVEITAPLAMVRILRLHQITSGYLPDPDDEEGVRFVSIGKTNPRLDLLEEMAADTPHQAIIWARFQRDILLIEERLRKARLSCVTYHGPTKQKDREEALRRFHAGDAQFFVANAACIGMGVTLTEAKSVIYYNNSFSYEQRAQSEDRAHRIGQHNAVNYYDIAAEDTVDEKIILALRNKLNIASVVTGDTLKEWI